MVSFLFIYRIVIWYVRRLHENFIFLDTDSTTDNETTALLDDLTRLSNKPVTVVCGSLIRKLVNCPPSTKSMRNLTRTHATSEMDGSLELEQRRQRQPR